MVKHFLVCIGFSLLTACSSAHLGANRQAAADEGTDGESDPKKAAVTPPTDFSDNAALICNNGSSKNELHYYLVANDDWGIEANSAWFTSEKYGEHYLSCEDAYAPFPDLPGGIGASVQGLIGGALPAPAPKGILYHQCAGDGFTASNPPKEGAFQAGPFWVGKTAPDGDEFVGFYDNCADQATANLKPIQPIAPSTLPPSTKTP